MAILREYINPSSGMPRPVSLIPQTMVNQQFYNQQQQAPVTTEQMTPQGPQFEQDPNSQSYIMQQLANMKQRSSPPNLDPMARVKEVDSQSVAPENFQSYFDRLGLIDQMGKTMLGTEEAKAQYKQQQELKNILAQSVQPFQGVTLQPGPGGAYGAAVPSNPAANFGYAQQIAGNYGWNSPQELQAWYNLGMRESGWRNTAQNPTSTAYGIGQFLDSTWGGYGIAKTSDPGQQVEAMARYIRARYGSPSAALAWHYAHNWY